MGRRDEMLGKFSFATKATEDCNEEVIAAVAQKNEQLDFERKLRELEDKKLEEAWEGKEIKPFGLNLIIKPFDENPYVRNTTDSGLITDGGGHFRNPDTGEMDLLRKTILYAIVVDAGPDTRHVKKGDEIIYSAQRLLPVPFKNQGLCLLNEGAVLAIINTTDNLNDRFNGK